MTISFIFIIIFFIVIIVTARLSTFLMELDVAALQIARSAVTVRDFQTEAVVAARLAVVNNNNLVGEGTLAVDPGNAFDLTCHGIEYDVSRNASTLDLHTIFPGVVIE